MRIEVQKESIGRLERKLWVFDYREGRLILTEYHEQGRETTQHKYQGRSWYAYDERPYSSQLKKPSSIPEWVAREAKQILIDRQTPVHIGWPNAESQIGTI